VVYNLVHFIKYSRLAYYIKTAWINIIYFPQEVKCIYLWYKHVVNNDWPGDVSAILKVIKFKTDQYLKFEHHEERDKSVKAARILNKLSYKLTTEGEYDYYDMLEEKWGQLITWSTPQQDSDYFRFHSRFEKVVFEKDKKQFGEDRIRFHKLMEQKRERDLKLLFAVLNKYMDHIWY